MAAEARRMLEEMYLSAAEKGEKKAMLLVLDHADLFDVNCRDEEGKTALMLALDSRSIEMMELVLANKRVVLGDILLRAVNAQSLPAVTAICKTLDSRKELPAGLYCHSLNGDFHPDMTPAVLAAQRNQFDILKTLLEHGATIKDPDLCRFATEEFTLEHSVGRINVFRALTAVACICLTNEDPLEAAFKLSRKMKRLSETDFEFRAQYTHMAESCEEFAAELLDYVRNSKEQNIVLTHDLKEWSNDSFRGNFKEPFKVKAAIKYDQKQFVAHPHCQQSLVERWYHGLESWRRMASTRRLLLSMLVMLCFPLVSASYVVSRKIRPGAYLNTPYVRYLCHAASQLTFLALLVAHFVTFSNSEDGEDDDVAGVNVTLSVWEWLIVLFLLAMTWKEVSLVVNKGVAMFTENMEGKAFDIITLALYWAWLLCRLYVIWQTALEPKIELEHAVIQNDSIMMSPSVTVYHPLETSKAINVSVVYDGTPETVQGLLSRLEELQQEETRIQNQLGEVLPNFRGEEYATGTGSAGHRAKRAPARVKIGGSAKQGTAGTPYVSRNQTTMSSLSATHPILIGTGFIAIAKVFSFLGVARMTVVHLQIGPMQISFGRMGGDIVKFLVLFSLILVAFSVGMSELYNFYTADLLYDCISHGEPRCKIPYKDFQAALMSLFWSLFGMTPIETLEITILNHWVTELFGYFLFALYQLIAIVALLNILIAMMSNTYTRIEDDSDIQWKFARSTLWMSYYEESSSLSPPFNLIPSYGTIQEFCSSKMLKGKKARNRKKNLKVEIKDQEYKTLMKELVKRYIFDKKGDEEENSAQETYMLQLKQEVAGFKNDMFENMGNLSKTVSNIHKSVDENAPEDEGQFGTEFLKNVESVVKHAEDVALPIRPGIFRNGPSKPVDLAFADYEEDEL